MDSTHFRTHIVNMKESLHRFALNLTLEEDEANDLLQETYLKALSSNFDYSSYGCLNSWMYTIMKNIFINNYRRKNRIKDYYKDVFDSESGNVAYNDNSEAEINLRNKELYKALKNISDRYRIIFIMYAQGYKYTEISEKLNIPVSIIRNRIFVTRHSLQTKLKDLRY